MSSSSPQTGGGVGGKQSAGLSGGSGVLRKTLRTTESGKMTLMMMKMFLRGFKDIWSFSGRVAVVIDV